MLHAITRRLWLRAFPVALLSVAGLAAAPARGEINDQAGMFSQSALQSAGASLQQIQQTDGIPVLIEAYKEIPGDRKSEYSPANRDEFFAKWAQERFAAGGSQGVYVLICRSPGAVRVLTGSAAVTAMGADHSGEFRDVLLKNFKAKKFDQGLTEMVRKVELAAHASAAPAGQVPQNQVPDNAPAAGQPNNPGGVAGAPDIVVDSAGLFTANGKSAGAAIIQRIKQRTNLDVMVETFATLPSDVQSEYNQQTRLGILSTWAAQRYTANNVHGIYILVTRQPVNVTVRNGPETQGRMGSTRDTDVADIFGNDIRQGQPDQGLSDALHLIDSALDTGNTSGQQPYTPPFGQSNGQQTGQQWRPGPDPWPPSGIDGVVDLGQFFQVGTTNSVDGTATQIKQRCGRDVLIETRNDIPQSMLAQYNPQNVKAFTMQWAHQRYDLNHVHGVYVLFCRQTGWGWVLMGNDSYKVLGSDNAKSIASELQTYFRQGQFDQGVLVMMQNLDRAMGNTPVNANDDAQAIDVGNDDSKSAAPVNTPAANPVAPGAPAPAVVSPAAGNGVHDNAAFFSESGKSTASAMIDRIQAHSHLAILIETFPVVPLNEQEHYAKQSHKDFFNGWAEQRAQEDGNTGIYVLVCKDPKQLVVRLGSAAISALHGDKTADLRGVIVAKFKQSHYDDGLMDMLKDVEVDLHTSAKGS
jgi:uncharacterized membrane protein YgcG